MCSGTYITMSKMQSMFDCPENVIQPQWRLDVPHTKVLWVHFHWIPVNILIVKSAMSYGNWMVTG